MPASFTTKYSFGYGWFLGEDPGIEPLDYTTKVLDAVILDGFAQDVGNTAGLTYGYRGGWIYNRATRLPNFVAHGTVLLPPNRNCYIEHNDAGVVSYNHTGWTADMIPMQLVVTNNFEIISVQDCRVMNSSFPNLVTSVFERLGDIVATRGDYNAALITLHHALTRYPNAGDVQAVLDAMMADIIIALEGGVHSFGPVGGTRRTGNVFCQYGDYHAQIVGVDDTIPGVSLAGITNPSVQDALRAVAARSGVRSFNGRSGDVLPLVGDYTQSIVSYDDSAVEHAVLLPEDVEFGDKGQSALDALKVHFHDATQIMMNPEIVPGKDTVQKMLQWLYDTRTTVSALSITTGNYSATGLAPFDLDIPLEAAGGTAPYTWHYVSGNIPGDPANEALLSNGHLIINDIPNAGIYTARVRVTDSSAVPYPLSIEKNITVSLTSSAAVPTISSFTATPGTINSGGSSALAWTIANATALAIDNGVGDVTGLTTINVSPTTTTVYTITATNAEGNSAMQATVTVNNSLVLPEIVSFTASPSGGINSGGSATLSWNVLHATQISIDNGIGIVTGTSRVVSPAVDTTYTLTATNADGQDVATVQVHILVRPVLNSFTISPNPVYGIDSLSTPVNTTANFSVVGATKLELFRGHTGNETLIADVTGLTTRVITAGELGPVSHTVTSGWTNTVISDVPITLKATNADGVTTHTIEVERYPYIWAANARQKNYDQPVDEIAETGLLEWTATLQQGSTRISRFYISGDLDVSGYGFTPSSFNLISATNVTGQETAPFSLAHCDWGFMTYPGSAGILVDEPDSPAVVPAPGYTDEYEVIYEVTDALDRTRQGRLRFYYFHAPTA